jgi:hypothetical protein
MLISILYLILVLLVITTVIVVIRAVLYQRSMGAVEKVELLSVNEQQIEDGPVYRSALSNLGHQGVQPRTGGISRIVVAIIGHWRFEKVMPGRPEYLWARLRGNPSSI